MLLATPALAEPAPSWNCTLHQPGTKQRETLNIHRQANGYYGDGESLPFAVVEDGDWEFVVASSEMGAIEGSDGQVVGVRTLIIDKQTRLAQLSYNYVTGGYPDRTFYGVCVPG
jgi:hypothetical protein